MIATVTLNPSLDEWVQLQRLVPGQLNRATGFARYPGGKGINVSRVVDELGGRTVAVALAGGEEGHLLRVIMERRRIPVEFIAVAGCTRNNYKLQTHQPPSLTEINTPGPRVAAASLRQLQQRLFSLRPLPRCVVLSGSLPPGVPQTIYRRWLLRLRCLRIPAALDTSGAALREGVAAKPWLIKPNRQEAEELLGQRLDRRPRLLAGLRHLRRLGPELVLLSLGREGALLAAGDGTIWEATAPMVRTASAVGAGDSLVAGFVTGWCRFRRLLPALRLGVACGTATAMTPGTELCHRADVRRLLPRVRIRRVA